jgi:transmembrane sensor
MKNSPQGTRAPANRATVEWFVHEIDANRPGVPDWEAAHLNPQELAELQHMQRLWGLLGTQAARQRLALQSEPDSDERTLPDRRELSKDPETATVEPSRRDRWALAAGVLLATALASALPYLWGVYRDKLAGGAVQTYSTASSESKRVTLADGSKVILGARSQINVRFTDRKRTIDLVRGEALFDAAHDPTRAFEVIAGTGVITALGTRFDVTQEGDAGHQRVTVVVEEGAVQVGAPQPPEPSHPPQGASGVQSGRWSTARVERGQGISYDRSGPQQVTTADPDAVSSWVAGRLEFRHTPLRYVLSNVSRYSDKPIILQDDSVGDVPFTGIVYVDQIEGWFQALQSIYPVDIVNSAAGVVIRSRAAASPSTDVR